MQLYIVIAKSLLFMFSSSYFSSTEKYNDTGFIMDLNLLEGQGRSLPRPATIGPVRKRGQLACQVGQRPVTIPPVQTTEPQGL